MILETVAIALAKKGLETTASEFAKTLIETHMKPILQAHADFKDNSDEFQECLQEYLNILYQKSIIMNTIVFKGIKKTLCDLYVPLTIVNTNPDDQIQSLEIDDKCLEQFCSMNKILLVDTAGMGKSTITKFLIIKCITENKKIPILIELRKLKEVMEILDYIVSQFSLLGKKIDKEDVIKMLRQGEFVIFFDGYDEIENDLKGNLMNKIQDFILKAGENQYMITSREETDLNSLGDFKRFSIQPLSMQEAFNLIRLYDQNGELSERLIKRIKNDKQLGILKEFLNNAMLTSLLYKTFQYKEEIAYKKLDFYDQVYDALFNDHDKTKGGAYVHEKLSLLDSTDFERLLRSIAFLSLKKNKVEYQNKAEFTQIIQEAIYSMPWINTKVDSVLYDITHAVPFFQKDGVAYKWVHKSFMEYFAANFICFESNAIEKLLAKMANSPNIEYYTNVLDFCYEIKPEVFRKIIIYPFLCKYINLYNNLYTDKKFENYEYDFIDNMKFLSFVCKSKIYVYQNLELAEKAFDEFFEKESLYFDDSIGKIKYITHTAGDRILVASSYGYNMNIFQLLKIKNLDIFETFTYKKMETLKYNDIKEGVYIIDDNPEQWYNSMENYKILSQIWFRGTELRRQRPAMKLNFSKCLKLKKQLEKEMEIRKQIEIDLE